MKRAVPYPLLTVALLSMWLMLNDSTALDHILLGLVVGIMGGLAYARIAPSPGKVGKVVIPAATLAWLVLVDILRSNLAVLRIVTGIGGSGRVAGFLSIPLDLRDRRGLAVLACIVTATPGTAWAHYEAAANILTLHVLDLAEEDAWVRQFKDRYETRLMEIFP
jgi:multicomponent K+:H+ antiporter subunit E